MTVKATRSLLQVSNLDLHSINDVFRQLQFSIDELRGVGIAAGQETPVGPHTHPSFGGATVAGTVITPPTITSNQNNYNPVGWSDAKMVRLASNASRNITGLKEDDDGEYKVLHNVGTQNIVLIDESASSSVPNRLALDSDTTLRPDDVMFVQYDATSRRWRSIGNPVVKAHSALTGLVSPADDHTQYALDTHTFVTTAAEARLTAESVMAVSGGLLTLTGATVGLLNSAVDHGGLGGLADDDHTQYALLAGRSGGQTLIGGTAVADDLNLRATSGNGAGSETIVFQLGNNGALEAGRFTNESSIAHFLLGRTTALSSTHLMEINPSSTTVPLVLIAGSGTFEFWKDTTPSKAISFGLALPGVSIGNDVTIGTFSGSTWTSRLTIAESTGLLALPADPAWLTTFTPTVTSSTGTITTVSATSAYRRIGRTVILQFTISITTNGTGAGNLQMTLPIQASSAVNVGACRESAVNGKMGSVLTNGTSSNLFHYDNSYMGVDGAVINGTLVYEASAAG